MSFPGIFGIIALLVLIYVVWSVVVSLMQSSKVIDSSTDISTLDSSNYLSDMKMPSGDLSQYYPSSLVNTNDTSSAPNGSTVNVTSTNPASSTSTDATTVGTTTSSTPSSSTDTSISSTVNNLPTMSDMIPSSTSLSEYYPTSLLNSNPSNIVPATPTGPDPALVVNVPKAYTGAFDRATYLAANGDLAGIAPSQPTEWPYTHWLYVGMKEGRPGSGQTLVDAPPPPGYTGSFNEQTYLATNGDVFAAIKNGTLKGSGYDHWIRWGMDEGRSGSGFTKVS